MIVCNKLAPLHDYPNERPKDERALGFEGFSAARSLWQRREQRIHDNRLEIPTNKTLLHAVLFFGRERRPLEKNAMAREAIARVQTHVQASFCNVKQLCHTAPVHRFSGVHLKF